MTGLQSWEKKCFSISTWLDGVSLCAVTGTKHCERTDAPTVKTGKESCVKDVYLSVTDTKYN